MAQGASKDNVMSPLKTWILFNTLHKCILSNPRGNTVSKQSTIKNSICTNVINWGKERFSNFPIVPWQVKSSKGGRSPGSPLPQTLLSDKHPSDESPEACKQHLQLCKLRHFTEKIQSYSLAPSGSVNRPTLETSAQIHTFKWSFHRLHFYHPEKPAPHLPLC